MPHISSFANERGNAMLLGHNGVRLGHRSNVKNHFIHCLFSGTLDDVMITTITRLRVRSDLVTGEDGIISFFLGGVLIMTVF